jgi:eukaryotic-like serine/threonine-protein kinase
MSGPINQLSTALEGHYRIERALGVGGMAAVYQAHDVRHGRSVAIKVLHPDVAASIGRERFLAEIRTTANLAHPHILPLFDSGEAGGYLYYVMPLVGGESLRARLDRESPLEVDEALGIAREVADALAYAHERGVVHRDVKPENILLQSGHALVADFGIARPAATDGSERMTQIGVALGTPLYMSPEQAAGDPDLDARSDVYSLACVVFELLSGGPPFRGPTAESILVQRFTQPPPRLGVRRPGIPRHIEGALFRAMARDRDERFATMRLFREALSDPSSAARDADTDRSVAVLPFANMSADPDNEYFSDGIAEEIINALAQVPELHVAARTSAFSFKGKPDDLRAIGEKLRVRTVLEGSVRRAGNRVRINAQLISTADGYHLWSERYDRELTDIFAIQDEIARAIAGKLRVTLGSGPAKPLVKPPTDNLEAYELYLRARALMKERGTALLRATELLEQAVALDPQFAPALAYLAHALVLSGFWGLIPPAGIAERAPRAAASALEHDDQLVAAHTAAALVAICIRFDRVAARRAWDRAVEMDPTDAEARLMRAAFDLCYIQGDSEAAIRETRLAVDLDPLSAYAHAQLAVVLSFAERFDEAMTVAQHARELDPNSFFAVWALVLALTAVGDFEAFVALMSSLLPKYGRHPWLLMSLVTIGARCGRLETSLAYYGELVARSRTEFVQPTVLAVAAVHAGERAAAYQFLRQAAVTRDPVLAAFAMQSKIIDPLRGTPEFAEVLRTIGWE